MLRRKAWNHGIETWNWSICQWKLQTMMNPSVFGPKLFFFIFVSLKKTRLYIRSAIYLVFTIIHLKMIARKLLGPQNLMRTQAMCVYKVAQVFVISKNKNLVVTTVLIILPYFENINNGQKFTVVSFVLSFSYDYFT